MTETTVNIPLLRKAVEWAEAEAAKGVEKCSWYQGQWIQETDCGTSYCIAGYVAQLLDGRYAHSERVDGVRIDEHAADALGIETGQCGNPDCTCGVRLFSASNTIEEVRMFAESIAGERL